MSHFQNADVCPAARVAFSDPPTDVHEAIEFYKAAKYIDTAMGILKTAYAAGSMTSGAYDDFLSHVQDASEILEELGLLEDHDYIVEDLEPRALELLDTDDINVEDEALEFDSHDNALFGEDDRLD